MEMLTTKQVSDLIGKDIRTVQRKVNRGELRGEPIMNARNQKEYLIPLDVLDAPLQRKYYSQRSKQSSDSGLPQRKVATPLDLYTADEREEISFWTQTIERWQSYRNAPTVESKAEIDERFVAAMKLEHPELAMSVDTLYRRWKAIKENDLDGLIDKRGKWKKGRSTMNDTIWDVFLSFYLDPAQLPISQCLEYTTTWAQVHAPELVADMPNYTTFTRRIQRDIPDLVEILGREGEKAYRDRGGLFIRRKYEQMSSNEWWICDNHTFDIISKDENGTKHRLYLTAFFDARSSIFTGCYVTTSPSSQSTLIALRKGILGYGIPQNILGDNGREFLTFDMGGLGHRKRKPKDGIEPFSPPPIFQRLGINFTTAQVKNARAKTIERAFLDVKNQISRLFSTYTGGNVTEKPECLKEIIKDEKLIPTDKELTEQVEQLLRWYFNEQPYGGTVTADRGKPRMQVYNEHLHEKRIASAEELNLMLMRSTRAQKVGRRGVYVNVAGQRMEYTSVDLKQSLFNKQVYLRYDPDDMSEVRVYDLEDRFIMAVPSASSTVSTYNANHDELSEAIRAVRDEERFFKQMLKSMSTPAVGKVAAIDMALARAKMNSEAVPHSVANPKVYSLQRADEQPLFKEAVGFASLDTINKNAMRKQGGTSDE